MDTEFRRLRGFGVTGGVAFLVYWSAMYFTTAAGGMSQVAGAFAGFFLGTIASYIGNSVFVFKVKPRASNAIVFWLVNMVGLVINLIIAYALERLSFRPLETVIIIFITVPFLNYIGHRFWTFRADLSSVDRGEW